MELKQQIQQFQTLQFQIRQVRLLNKLQQELLLSGQYYYNFWPFVFHAFVALVFAIGATEKENVESISSRLAEDNK